MNKRAIVIYCTNNGKILCRQDKFGIRPCFDLLDSASYDFKKIPCFVVDDDSNRLDFFLDFDCKIPLRFRLENSIIVDRGRLLNEFKNK